MLDARKLIGSHNVLFITLDTLRYDVARQEMLAGRTPNLARVVPGTRWEQRHTPGSFTYPAHQAFFAGFLPTPIEPGKHPRLFALNFPGAETIAETTLVLDAPNIVAGFRTLGFTTICIGGVGFFNRLSPLACALPDLFDISIWRPDLGVAERNSTELQVTEALKLVHEHGVNRKLFLFLNISAIHQPNCMYLPGATQDNLDSHAAALRYVDSQLGRLFDNLQRLSATLCVICSDHGTAYGEDGYTGHRLAHPVVWTVPYAEFVLPREEHR